MIERRWTMWAVAALLALLVTVSAPAFAQTEEAEAPTGTPQSETVEEILRQQEQLITGERFSYDPAGRRDPFRNPNVKVEIDDPGCQGVQCMGVAEIDLSGIVKDDRDGDVAMFVGSDNNGYFLRVGDSVVDGTIIAIDARLGTVTFRQEIDDPTRIKPYRDVTKRLVALEDEESNR